MDTEILRTITDSHQWTALLPELMLGCLAVLLLFVDLLVPKSRAYIAQVSILFQLIASGWLLYHIFNFGKTEGGSDVLFNGMLLQTAHSDWMRIFFLFSSICVTHLGSVFLKKHKLARVEFYHILLVVTACFMVLVQSNHFILLFVALETLTIGFYVLVSYNRKSQFSLEAGLKYLVMGAFSSGIMLFGIALLYGAAGNPLFPGTAIDPLNFGQLAAFIGATDEFYNNSGNLLVAVGVAFVLVGVAFKIGAVPFQIWIPDVYQGAPTPVTALLAVASKAGGFYLLYLLISGPFADMGHLTTPILTVIAVLTLIFGNIAALGQRNVKRVMGMSGVAHAGILLMGILATASVSWAFNAVLFYLFMYALASFGAFEVMTHMGADEDADQDLDRYDDLLKRNPMLGGTLLVSLGSLAGIPPLAGFIAKLLIFVAAFQAGLYGLLGVALVGVVISIYYYFGWMRSVVMHNPFIEEKDREPFTLPGFGAKIYMSVLIACTLFFGFYQGFFVF